jgi:hypothetical protein
MVPSSSLFVKEDGDVNSTVRKFTPQKLFCFSSTLSLMTGSNAASRSVGSGLSHLSFLFDHQVGMKRGRNWSPFQ